MQAPSTLLEAWKGERFSYEGKFYRFTDAAVAPRPYRLPHPPLRMAATTPETFPRVARMGLPIFVGLRGMSIPELSAHLETYRAACDRERNAADLPETALDASLGA